jgi:monofunctional glycosyltransferase
LIFENPDGVKRLIRKCCLIILFTLLLGCIVITIQWFLLPNPARYQSQNPHTTAFIKQKCPQGCPIQWTQRNRIAETLIDAVLFAEDPRFFKHHGFDWYNLKHALKLNIKRRRLIWGASSLSMQLAKNLYLSPEKSWHRKFKEILLTIKIERSLEKNRILEIYLNVVEWGPEVFGIRAAAQHYYQKHPSSLSPSNCAYLASILPNPLLAESDPWKQRFDNTARQILERLVKRGPAGVSFP